MADTGEGWFREIRYTNSQLRKKGVKFPQKPPHLPNPVARPNKNDTEFLRTCGVAWEREPALQLSLDFSDCGAGSGNLENQQANQQEE
jgi:hypothetical protein